MGWYANTLEALKEITAARPLECPRGWGELSFVGSVWIIPPMAGAERSCPIGGVSDCSQCTYASNPSAYRLSEHLTILDGLRSDGALSEAEYATRRSALIHLHPSRVGRGLRIAAWIMGPLGLLVCTAGAILAGMLHPGFWGMVGAGAVLVVLSFSFWMLSRPAEEASSNA